MSEQHPHRATIQPVPGDTQRPLWSVMIPTYNCVNYLRETLTSVLAQDPGQELMQIEVVDDHSTKDDPEAVVQELGGGRVKFYRQPQNVGHVKNFQTCLERSQGRLIHLLHGDDCVLNNFYSKMQQAFDINSEIGAAFCRHIFMDERGHWQSISSLLQSESGILNNWLERIIVKQYIQTPSIVVRRDVYERLSGFDRRLLYYEDWEMWVRIAAHYPVYYEAEPLAAYRLHSNSNSGRNVRTGENVRDVRRGLEIVQSYLPNYLPKSTISKLINENREHSAACALETARQMFEIKDGEAGTNQVKEALRCSRSLKIVRRAARILFKAGAKRVKQIISSSNSKLEHN